jgi:UDP-glucose 4-epimerase
MQARHWDHADWYSNSHKARRLLRWKATTPLNQGLKMTAEWITANPTLVSLGLRESVTGAINAR